MIIVASRSTTERFILPGFEFHIKLKFRTLFYLVDYLRPVMDKYLLS